MKTYRKCLRLPITLFQFIKNSVFVSSTVNHWAA